MHSTDEDKINIVLSSQNLKKCTVRDKAKKSDHLISQFAGEINEYNRQRNSSEAQRLWLRSIEIIREWEKTSQKTIHKGTPYYFLSIASFCLYDFDCAIPALYESYLEDRKNQKKIFKQLPAFGFLSLQNKDEFAYNQLIKAVELFLNRRVITFNKNIEASFDYQKLTNLFLIKEQHKYQQYKVIFLNSIFRIWRLRILHSRRLNEKNPASNIITWQSIIGLLCLTEDIAPIKYMGNIYKKLETNCSWEKIDKIDEKEAEIILFKMLKNKKRVRIKNKWLSSNNYEQYCLFFAWKLRNIIAHHPTYKMHIWDKHYNKTIDLVLGAFFTVLNNKRSL